MFVRNGSAVGSILVKDLPANRPTPKTTSPAESDGEIDGLTKAELLERATEADIEGRSTMSKAELLEALKEA